MPCALCTHELDERKRLRPADRICKVNDMGDDLNIRSNGRG